MIMELEQIVRKDGLLASGAERWTEIMPKITKYAKSAKKKEIATLGDDVARRVHQFSGK